MQPAPDPVVPTIGVFDSGVGGLSVLRALRSQLPGAALHYLADSAHAPYGDRSADDVAGLSVRIAGHLLESGARMVVVACNTATTAAIGALRARWPELPFVGVEPGVKPAAALTANGRVGVLATRGTVASARMRELVERHAEGVEVTLQACPGLVDAIEAGVHEGAALQVLLAPFCAPLAAAGVDTVVLGCTHYPFVAGHIAALLGPQVRLVDTAEAVATRAAALWTEPPSPEPSLRFETTGDPARLDAFARRWLGIEAASRRVAP